MWTGSPRTPSCGTRCPWGPSSGGGVCRTREERGTTWRRTHCAGGSEHKHSLKTTYSESVTGNGTQHISQLLYKKSKISQWLKTNMLLKMHIINMFNKIQQKSVPGWEEWNALQDNTVQGGHWPRASCLKFSYEVKSRTATAFCYQHKQYLVRQCTRNMFH